MLVPSLRSLFKQAGPSLLVVLPLTGLAFLADERRSVYLRALTNDANPISAAVDAARGTDNFFFDGNFRPVGRFWEMLVHAFVFEAGAATGVAPHIVLGVVRITLVVLLALGATATVRALARSAGVHPKHSLLGLFPLALGAVLVANGRSGALAQFPHTLIGSVLLIVAVAALISRDRDMQQRSLRWYEYFALAATGVLAATFYDGSRSTRLRFGLGTAEIARRDRSRLGARRVANAFPSSRTVVRTDRFGHRQCPSRRPMPMRFQRPLTPSLRPRVTQRRKPPWFTGTVGALQAPLQSDTVKCCKPTS